MSAKKTVLLVDDDASECDYESDVLDHTRPGSARDGDDRREQAGECHDAGSGQEPGRTDEPLYRLKPKQARDCGGRDQRRGEQGRSGSERKAIHLLSVPLASPRQRRALPTPRFRQLTGRF